MSQGQEIIAEIRRIAAENPDYVYPLKDCAYVIDGQPSCLVGKALWNLELIDESFPARINYDTFDTVAAELDIDVDFDEIDWIVDAQERQDANVPWGVAVIRADVRSSLREDEE